MYGGPEVLRFEEAPLPKLQADEVLIQIHAAGVNPVDWKIRAGMMKGMLNHSLPLIPGWDVSGIVVAVGREVRRIQVGNEVYGLLDICRNGAYAEYAVARESAVALKPKPLDHIQAAAIPMSSLAAWQSLFHAGELQSSHKVLIHGAAGGVGSFAVQLAKWKGAHVIGTASKRNHRLLRELGTDETIDHTTMRFEDAVRDADVVLDTVGGDTLSRSWGVLKKGGILVSIAEQPSPEEAVRNGVRQACVFVVPKAEELEAIGWLVDSGALKPVVRMIFPLSQAYHAHKIIQSGHVRGKIVLRVDR